MAFVACLLGLVLVAADPGADPADDLKAYDEARAKVGHDADAHVRLALWCEARGLSAERLKHLTLAVLNRPEHPLARGLLGLVSFGGKWQRPEAVGEKVRSDAGRAEIVAQYLEKRVEAGETAKAQYALGLWCEKNGLTEAAVAHFRGTLRHDPNHEGAHKRLGDRKMKGVWVNEAKAAAVRAEVELQKAADRRWKPVLDGYRRDYFGGHDPAVRAKAEETLAAVCDPRSVPTVWAVFAAKPDDRCQTVAVQLFGQIDAMAASKALAILAVSGHSAEVHRAATETLRRRDPREFAELLVALVRAPIQYKVRDVGGQGLPGVLSVSGEKVDVRRVYSPPPVAFPTILPTDQIRFDDSGLPVLVRMGRNRVSTFEGPVNDFELPGRPNPGFSQKLTTVLESGLGDQGAAIARRMMANSGPQVINFAPNRKSPSTTINTDTTYEVDIPIGQIMVEANIANLTAEQRLKNDVAALDAQNRQIGDSNARVLLVLAAVAGHDYGADPEAWKGWWDDQIGYARPPRPDEEKPTYVEQVSIDYVPPPISPTVTVQQTKIQVVRSHSCFGAGTLVATLDGPRAIESLATGDLVLAQDTRTGALGYKPVVAAYKNPPSPTYRVSLDGGKEAVVTSPFHRFWKAGQGWVMARDLKTGDVLRTVGGLTRVEAKDDDAVQPVYNLEVADSADFFVGRAGTLVHDITLPDLRVTPFDAPTP